MVEIGTLGAITGLPETFKSWLLMQLALKVAGAGGKVFGLAEVLKTGPVGYWWQDDSERNELARLQAYSQRHGYEAALPLRWHLNEGLTGIPPGTRTSSRRGTKRMRGRHFMLLTLEAMREPVKKVMELVFRRAPGRRADREDEAERGAPAARPRARRRGRAACAINGHH